MNVNIGYVLFSKKVVNAIALNPSLASFVGDCIGRHIRGEHGETGLATLPLQEGIQIKSLYRKRELEIVIITELDKNTMPRTTVVFFEESGGI